MSRDGITKFLSVNRSLTSLGGETRQLQLPRMNPFPKLDNTVIRSGAAGERRTVSAHTPAQPGTVIISGDVGLMPEVVTDMIDPAAAYVVENVKRDHGPSRPGSRLGLGHWIGRLLGSHRAART